MATDERITKAEKDYLAGMKYKDLATKYDVSINTVKSWIKRHGWTRDGAPKSKKEVHPKTRGAPTKAIDELEANSELNDKQKLFCLFYLQSFNATKSYQKAYGVDYKSAMTAASRLLSNDKVQAQIKKLKLERQKNEFITAEDVLHELERQAFANLGDFVEVETVDMPLVKYGHTVTNPLTGEPVTYKENNVNFKGEDEVDMSQLQGVHIERGELVVELPDKQRALVELLKHLEVNNDDDGLPVIKDDVPDVGGGDDDN